MSATPLPEGDDVPRTDDTDGPAPLAVTPDQAAAMLSISRSALYGLLRTGELRPMRMDRSRRIPVADIEAFVQAQRDT